MRRYTNLLDVSAEQASALFNRCFEGYLVPVHLEAASFAGLARSETIDLAASLRVEEEGQCRAISLVARRGRVSRVAAMAVAPEGRRQGLGRELLERLLFDALHRGDSRLVLEVIEQNEAAVRLYESAGFTRVRRLVGYTRRPAAIAGEELVEIETSEVAAMVGSHGMSDLPWQIDASSIAQASLPSRAYRLGPACAAVSDPAGASAVVRCLVVDSDERRQGWGGSLLRSVVALNPEATWRVIAICPEEVPARLFESAGFERDTLSQLQMELVLG